MVEVQESTATASEEAGPAERIRDLEARLEEAGQNTRAVIEVIQAVGEATNLRQLQAAALESGCKALDFQYGACWMIDRAIQATSFSLEYGSLGPRFDKVNQTAHWKCGQGLGGRTWKARDLLFIPDLTQIKDSVMADEARAAGMACVITVPFIVRDEVEGVLFFWSSRLLHPSRDRLNVIRKIGFLVGQAFARLQDLEESERQQKMLRDRAASVLEVVRKAQAGDLTQAVELAGEDAVGQIATGLGDFLSKLRESMRRIAGNAKLLTDSVNQLNALGKGMSANATETAHQASQVTSASANVSDSIDAVAANSSEMLSSIQEISRSAQDSARVTRSAVRAAEVCTGVVGKLGDSSREISKVVKVISSVAQQTNLLALNATIEAARAGEAGKGFAVVANEVKELAKETARATEEIGRKIETIQADTKTAIRAIEDITGVIGQIDAASAQIAAGVEEQTATTRQIGKHVGEAAGEAGAIAQSIARVAQTAQATTQVARDMESAARTLHEMALQLDSLVAGFKVD